VIIPLWHGFTRGDVLRFSPTQADKFALSTADRELDDLVTEILRAIRPDLADRIAMFKKYLKIQGNGEIQQVPPETLAMLPPPEVVEIESYVAVRALNVVNTLGVATGGLLETLWVSWPPSPRTTILSLNCGSGRGWRRSTSWSPDTTPPHRQSRGAGARSARTVVRGLQGPRNVEPAR